jgi:hypothetical protein
VGEAGQNVLRGQVAEWHGVKSGLDTGRDFWSSMVG